MLTASPEKAVKYMDIYYDSIGKYINSIPLRSCTPNAPDIQKQEKYQGTTDILSNNDIHESRKSIRFQPKLNKKSIKIASKLGDSKKRLTTSPNKIKFTEDFNTHHPEINKISQKLTEGRDNGKNVWNSLYDKGEDKKKAIERLKLKIRLIENYHEEYSFRPNILQNSSNRSKIDIAERLYQWAKDRECKIKEKKDANADKDMKECTFYPRITENKLFNDNFTDIKGVSTYIERGRRIKNDMNLECMQIKNNTVVKDVNKKKYKEILNILHEEVQSLDI
ncbi:hypothetical protein SteCoe_6097 [Stentor coeruleus]|uniref:Uncharacterized protein n=1 Tax=Stentor coeruleus TaxID=5963 RepID=A0A1R2CQY2_9CILI|nr:hypothetical protein SteCoe_6097 [Stentor coeruleus]